MAETASGGENVIAVTFKEDSMAYEAMSTLKELDSQGQINVIEASVVERGQDGHVVVKDDVGETFLDATAGGGLIGLLIGIIGGPLGVLIGGATGVLVGSLFDADDADKTESALSEISSAVVVGHTALLAQVGEPSPEVIDTAMAGLGGTVLRRSVADVEAEIAASEKAQKEAKRKARKELFESHQKQRKEDIQAKVQALKDKLHHNKQTAPTGS